MVAIVGETGMEGNEGREGVGLSLLLFGGKAGDGEPDALAGRGGGEDCVSEILGVAT